MSSNTTVPCKQPEVCGVSSHIRGSAKEKQCAAQAKANARKKKERVGFKEAWKTLPKNKKGEDQVRFSMQSDLGSTQFVGSSANSYLVKTPREVTINGVPMKIEATVKRNPRTGKLSIPYVDAYRTDMPGRIPVSDAALDKIESTLLEEGEAIFDDPEYRASMRQAAKQKREANLEAVQAERQAVADELESVESTLSELDPNGVNDPANMTEAEMVNRSKLYKATKDSSVMASHEYLPYAPGEDYMDVADRVYDSMMDDGFSRAAIAGDRNAQTLVTIRSLQGVADSFADAEIDNTGHIVIGGERSLNIDADDVDWSSRENAAASLTGSALMEYSRKLDSRGNVTKPRPGDKPHFFPLSEDRVQGYREGGDSYHLAKEMEERGYPMAVITDAGTGDWIAVANRDADGRYFDAQGYFDDFDMDNRYGDMAESRKVEITHYPEEVNEIFNDAGTPELRNKRLSPSTDANILDSRVKRARALR